MLVEVGLIGGWNARNSKEILALLIDESIVGWLVDSYYLSAINMKRCVSLTLFSR